MSGLFAPYQSLYTADSKTNVEQLINLVLKIYMNQMRWSNALFTTRRQYLLKGAPKNHSKQNIGDEPQDFFGI